MQFDQIVVSIFYQLKPFYRKKTSILWDLPKLIGLEFTCPISIDEKRIWKIQKLNKSASFS